MRQSRLRAPTMSTSEPSSPSRRAIVLSASSFTERCAMAPAAFCWACVGAACQTGAGTRRRQQAAGSRTTLIGSGTRKTDGLDCRLLVVALKHFTEASEKIRLRGEDRERLLFIEGQKL